MYLEAHHGSVCSHSLRELHATHGNRRVHAWGREHALRLPIAKGSHTGLPTAKYGCCSLLLLLLHQGLPHLRRHGLRGSKASIGEEEIETLLRVAWS